MDIKSNSELYSTMQNGLELKVVDKNTIKMNQKGINIIKNNIKIVIRIYTDDKMKKGTLYRSIDFGKTWESVELRAATFNLGVIWSRDIIHIGNGLFILISLEMKIKLKMNVLCLLKVKIMVKHGKLLMIFLEKVMKKLMLFIEVFFMLMEVF